MTQFRSRSGAALFATVERVCVVVDGVPEFLLELQPNSASETPNADIATPIETDFLEPSENITFSLAFALLLRVIRNLECPNRVEHQAVALSARDVTAGEFLLL